MFRETEIRLFINDPQFLRRPYKIFYNLASYTGMFEIRYFCFSRSESGINGERQKRKCIIFDMSVYSQFIPLRKTTAYGINIFMKESDFMNNDGSIVGGGVRMLVVSMM